MSDTTLRCTVCEGAVLTEPRGPRPAWAEYWCASADHARISALVVANAELLKALKAIAPYIPTTSASEGGAAKHSANVKAADLVRAAIAKHKGTS